MMEADLDGQTLNLGGYEGSLRARMERLEQANFGPRLWQKDGSLWQKDVRSQEMIPNALGWLTVAEQMEKHLDDLGKFVAEVRDSGFRHVVHMGMGGSSLAPMTFKQVLPPSSSNSSGGLTLSILDTTDPATIRKIENEVPLQETLFIVASKSGTTIEPTTFGEYFYAKVKAQKGTRAGENFVAITDPGSPLVRLANERAFRRVFLSPADIGGRFSALSPFGLVPAALAGIRVGDLLSRARQMIRACGPDRPIAENPGILLGAVMGELGLQGRDKITFLLPDSVSTLGLWLEQLIAESTGKEGRGFLPVAGEPLADPAGYGPDRLFVYISCQDEPPDRLAKFVDGLAGAGHPVVRVQIHDRLNLGQEFFRWEIATATAGAVLEINPFDQPNVQESKDNTNGLLKKFIQSGRLPEPPATMEEEPLLFYGVREFPSARDVFKSFFDQSQPGDYFALQAYLPETPAVAGGLQKIQRLLQEGLRLPTTLGYGPRFLHSTGQYHKGGPNKGLFLQITADDLQDVPIPGFPYTFGNLKRAQALGDLEALHEHGRRAIRVHLRADIHQGLKVLAAAMEAALKG